MSADLSIGLVGCGRLAEIGYLPAIDLATGVRLVAVADRDDERAGHVAALAGAGVDTFAGAAELVRGARVDALVLATPAAAHVADAEVAVAAGLAVLVEKPPASDLAGARRLAALGPAVRVGFNRRFDGGALRLRRQTPADGRVEVEVAIRYRRSSWRSHEVDDDVLADLGPHLVDWVRWLTAAEVAGVRAVELTPDRAEVGLELAGGRGRARLVAAAHRFHEERIEVRDGTGELQASHRVGGPLAAVTGRLRRRPGPHPLVGSLADQLVAFAGVVRGADAPLLGTAADGVAVMAVLDAARASAAAGATVPVDLPLPEPRPC